MDGSGAVNIYSKWTHPQFVAEIVRLHAELARYRAWIGDLQSGMYVNCVYCGHRYGPGETTPVSMADALKAHVEQCPEHPMSCLRAEVERLRHPWRNVDEKDWEHLKHDIADSGHGRFWKAVLADMRVALAPAGKE